MTVNGERREGYATVREGLTARGARTNDDDVPQLQQTATAATASGTRENDQRGGPPRSRHRCCGSRDRGCGRGTGKGVVFIIERDRWLQRENKPPPVRHTRVPCVYRAYYKHTHAAARRRRIPAARIRAICEFYVYIYNIYI